MSLFLQLYVFPLSLTIQETGEFVRGTAIPDESYRDDDEGTGGDYDGDGKISCSSRYTSYISYIKYNIS